MVTPMLCRPSLEDIERVLGSVWSYRHLRQPQRRAALAVLAGRDALVTLPTGGGKSLCYQLPALVLPGLTLVVSPLISLMQDQVNALRSRGVAAAYLSSTQRPEVQATVRELVGRGQVRILYAAPERVAQMPALLRGRRVSLLAVDEAHCISEWGHDFRPHYRRLGDLRGTLGGPPTIALTATATPETREDITRVLRLERPVLVLSSFDRPNLHFNVRRAESDRERFSVAEGLVRGLGQGSTIVYVPTKNRADGVAKVFRWHGLPAAPYHAGLGGPARRALLRRFLDGDIRIMVATTAFGMGIDKPDVRLVVHLGVPFRPESYYQEAGRAGRDGQPARCELLWCAHDLQLATSLSRGSRKRAKDPPAHWEAARRGLETMIRYISSRRCRRAVLLEYLGEKLAHCSGCDRCGWGGSL